MWVDAGVDAAEGGTQIIFWGGCVCSQGLKPLPINKDFLSLKNGWLDIFWNFRKSGPISKGVLPEKQLILPFFFWSILVKWVPLLRIFWPKGDPCLRILVKKYPFGWHIRGMLQHVSTSTPPPPPPPVCCLELSCLDMSYIVSFINTIADVFFTLIPFMKL